MLFSRDDTPEARRAVRVFGTASFLHDVGADMIFSVWPLFLTRTLGASMSAVGLIDGIGESMVSLSQAYAGYLSDRLRKRKIFVWLGYLFGGVARLGYAIAPSWPFVIPFRILDRSGKIRSTPRDAIVSDLSSRSNRGRHFGFLRLMDNFGAVVGILVSIILVRVLPLRTIFLLAAIPSLLAVTLVLLAARERAPDGNGKFQGIRLGDLTPNLRLLFAGSALHELGAFSYSFLLLAAEQFAHFDGNLPVLYLLFTVVAAAVSLPAGRLADRIGRKPVLLFSLLLWTLVCAAFLTGSTTMIVLGILLYGGYKGFLDPVQKAFVAELAPNGLTASTLGGFQLMVGVCSLFASLAAGILWDRFGIGIPFVLSAVLTGLGVIVLTRVREATA